MSITQRESSRHDFLILSLILIIVIYLIGNIIEQENYPLSENWYFTDILFIITPIVVISLGIILNLMYRFKGNHGKGWIFFTLAITCWFIGELTYNYENEYDIENISTFTSDIFYIFGYPMFFGFEIFYLHARRKIITKNKLILASLFSIALVIPSLYITLDVDYEMDNLTMILYSIYPILDGIILVPAIIAMFLFFGGKVNLLWTLIMIATIVYIAADTVYLMASLDDSFGPSHLINIFYIWPYILYAFGLYSHIKLFKKVAK